MHKVTRLVTCLCKRKWSKSHIRLGWFLAKLRIKSPIEKYIKNLYMCTKYQTYAYWYVIVHGIFLISNECTFASFGWYNDRIYI